MIVTIKTMTKTLYQHRWLIGTILLMSMMGTVQGQSDMEYNDTMVNATIGNETVPDDAQPMVVFPSVNFDRIQTRGYIHGWTMALAWGLFVPMAIASSLLRMVIGKSWLQIHFFSNSMAFLLASIGFGLEVKNIEELDFIGYEHFSTEIPHQFIGLIIYILMALQVLSGVFRPAAPHPVTDEHDETSSTPAAVAGGSTRTTAVMKKSVARHIFEIQHRYLGLAVVIVAWYQCHSGITDLEGIESKSYTPYKVIFWIVIGLIVGLTMIIRLVVKNRDTTN